MVDAIIAMNGGCVKGRVQGNAGGFLTALVRIAIPSYIVYNKRS